MSETIFRGLKNHLSVGALLRREDGWIAYHYEDGLRACMTETVENGEALEGALKRGLMEEYGMTCDITGFAGVSTQTITTNDRGTFYKSIAWFDCLLTGETDLGEVDAIHFSEELPNDAYDVGRWPLFTHAMPKSEDKVISNDDKLPVDVRIAGGTVGKGCKFETLLIRINAFNQFYDENLVDKKAQRKARENLLALITPQPSTDVSELEKDAALWREFKRNTKFTVGHWSGKSSERTRFISIDEAEQLLNEYIAKHTVNANYENKAST